VNVATMPHPGVYLDRIATLFDGEGRLIPDTREFLRGVSRQLACVLRARTARRAVAVEIVEKQPSLAETPQNPNRALRRMNTGGLGRNRKTPCRPRHCLFSPTVRLSGYTLGYTKLGDFGINTAVDSAMTFEFFQTPEIS